MQFTDDAGQPTGKQMHFQLKAGGCHLTQRKRGGARIFALKRPRWVKPWTCPDGPTMLVIGTFPEERERPERNEEKSFPNKEWMR